MGDAANLVDGEQVGQHVAAIQPVLALELDQCGRVEVTDARAFAFDKDRTIKVLAYAVGDVVAGTGSGRGNPPLPIWAIVAIFAKT